MSCVKWALERWSLVRLLMVIIINWNKLGLRSWALEYWLRLGTLGIKITWTFQSLVFCPPNLDKKSFFLLLKSWLCFLNAISKRASSSDSCPRLLWLVTQQEGQLQWDTIKSLGRHENFFFGFESVTAYFHYDLIIEGNTFDWASKEMRRF